MSGTFIIKNSESGKHMINKNANQGLTKAISKATPTQGAIQITITIKAIIQPKTNLIQSKKPSIINNYISFNNF